MVLSFAWFIVCLTVITIAIGHPLIVLLHAGAAALRRMMGKAGGHVRAAAAFAVFGAARRAGGVLAG